MTDIVYRPATPTEALPIARLMIAAADGLGELLFDNLVPNHSAEQTLASIVEKDQGEFSYRNAYVGTDDSRVIALALTYPASQNRITPELKELIPQDRLEIVADFFNNRVEGSLFLNTLSVAPEYRNLGIGSYLINFVKTKARTEGFSSVSLFAWADNEGALRLYRRQGFMVVKPINILPHPLLNHPDGGLLMNCLV